MPAHVSAAFVLIRKPQVHFFEAEMTPVFVGAKRFPSTARPNQGPSDGQAYTLTATPRRHDSTSFLSLK